MVERMVLAERVAMGVILWFAAPVLPVVSTPNMGWSDTRSMGGRIGGSDDARGFMQVSMSIGSRA